MSRIIGAVHSAIVCAIALVLLFGAMQHASASVVADFTASPAEIASGNDVELKLVLFIYFGSSVSNASFDGGTAPEEAQAVALTHRAWSVECETITAQSSTAPPPSPHDGVGRPRCYLR